MDRYGTLAGREARDCDSQKPIDRLTNTIPTSAATVTTRLSQAAEVVAFAEQIPASLRGSLVLSEPVAEDEDNRGDVAASLTENDALSVSDSIPPSIRELWQQAVEHAGVAEDDLHLLAGLGDPFNEREPSVHLQPGVELAYNSCGYMFNQASLDEANHPTNLHRHRIGLRCNFPYDTPLGAAVALGLLRHEIEHALQYSGSDAEQLYALDCIADDIAEAKDGPEGNTYYRLKPTELGANAAAASLVLPTATPAVVTELRASKFAPFVTPQTTIPVADVPRLTVQFIYEQGSLEALVEDAYTGAGEWWRELADGAT